MGMKQWVTKHRNLYIGIIVAIAVIGVGLALFMSRDKPVQTPVTISPSADNASVNSEYTITKPNVTCTLSMPPTCGGDITVKSANIDGVQIIVDNNTKVRHKDQEIQPYLNALKEGMHINLTMRPNTSIADSITIVD